MPFRSLSGYRCRQLPNARGHPPLQRQISDEPFDWTAITSVELVGLRNEENYPMATSRRIIQHSLDFEVYIQISIPADIRDEIVRRVFIRVGCVNNISGPSSNIVTDIHDRIELMASVIETLDTTTPQVLIEAKIIVNNTSSED